MNAKEKAKELVEMFIPYVDLSDGIENAKKCAMLVAEELKHESIKRMYWVEVRSEIRQITKL